MIHTTTPLAAHPSPAVSQKWVKRCELGPLPVDVHYRTVCNGVDAEIEGVVICGSEPIDPGEFSRATLNLWRAQIEADLARLCDDLRAGG